MSQFELEDSDEIKPCWQCGSRKGPAKPGEVPRNAWLAKRWARPAVVCAVCGAVIVRGKSERRVDAGGGI